MASHNSISLLVLLLLVTGGHTSSTNDRKTLHLETNLHDTINSPTTILPTTTTTPITNPANFPPYTPTPTVVTIPASNPTPLNPLNPTPTAPTTTIPASTPSTTSPATQTPIISGQTWCVAQSGASESSLQSALDYACGIGDADCSTIQQGASCYNPNTLENHASYAFNSYFQNNPVTTSCNFGGAAMIVNTNPSSGSCIYPSSATGAGAGAGTATPASTVPPATTSSTDGASGSPYGASGTPYGTSGSPYGGVSGSPYDVPASGGYGSPPSSMNSSYPASGLPSGYGPDSPPTGYTYPAASTSMQPCISFIVLVTFLSTAKLILD